MEFILSDGFVNFFVAVFVFLLSGLDIHLDSEVVNVILLPEALSSVSADTAAAALASDMIVPGRRMRVLTRDGRSFDCDRLVITAPPPVARCITFTPELPMQLQLALSQVQLGLLNLVVLQFPERFWPADINFIAVAETEQQQVRFPLFLNLAPVNAGRALLMAQVFGHSALCIEDMNERQVAELALKSLRTAYPACPEPIGCKKTSWKADPFARGSYFFACEQSPQSLCGELAQAHSLHGPWRHLMFLAGEACSSDCNGLVHGAMLSGRAAALEILKLDSIESTETSLTD
jgi:monoamine oxidase